MSDDKKDKPKPRPLAALVSLSSVAPCDNRLEAKYPTLHQYMTPVYEDRVCVRQGASLSIRADGTYWRVSVVCPTELLQSSLVTDTLMDLHGQLEAFLSSGAALWTPTFDKSKKSRPVIDKLIQ